MHAPRPARIHAEPNVTPMIDVMLVLLIIFMAVAPLLDAGAVMTLPKGQHLTQHPEEDHEAVIALDARGQFFFNKRAVSEAELRTRLRARFAGAPLDRVVYLRADRTLEYRLVRNAMALAADEGARVVGLITTPVAPSEGVGR